MKAAVIAFGLGGALLLGCSENNRVGNTGKSAADVPATDQARDGQDATNTGRNVRDRDEANPTADDQSQSKDEIDTAAKIRRAVVDDKSLSTNAHNVKIIAKDGEVTLRGPVDSEAEKEAIVAKAKEVAGDDRVVDELELKTAP
jgi:hyperosmotically inducible protein